MINLSIFFNILLLIILFAFPILFEYFKFNYQKQKGSFFKYFLERFGLLKFNWKTLLKGFGLSIVLIFVNVIIITIGTYLSVNDIPSQVQLVANFKSLPIFFSIYLLISSVAEEFFFRAFLNKYFGIILSTLFFAFMHYSYSSYFQIIGAFILGLILAIVWKRSNNFYIVAIAHFLQNLFSILLILFSMK